MSVQDAIEIDGDPTAVYRLYSKDGTLLYVGVTRNIPERFYQHEVYKHWWPHVARKTMNWYGSRTAALAAEAAAIVSERPVYNIAGVSSEEDDPTPKTGRRRNWSVSMLEAEAKMSAWVEAGAPESPASPAKPPRADPAHVEIARRIEAAIRSGGLPANVKLPPDLVIGEWYGASATTVGKAVRILHERGLVVRRGSGGTFVRKFLPSEECAPQTS